MSLHARRFESREGRVSLSHALDCPAETKTWADCNCGLFQGYHQPLAHGGNHKDDCPCHCQCDFGAQLLELIES